MPSAFITGARGFLGGHITRQLLDAGWEVTALLRPGSDGAALSALGVKVVEAPMDNATARSVFVIGPDKKIKATLTYPMSTGRNFAEILRLLDSCQLTAERQLATPANWEQGDDVIIVPSVSDEEARKRFPDGWKQPLPYIRLVPQPRDD